MTSTIHTETAHDAMVANVLQEWNACDLSEWREGREWYPTANALARELSPQYVRASYVLAALSPRQAWARNVSLAREAYRLMRSAPQDHPEMARERILRGLPTLGLQRRQVVALLVDSVDPDLVVKGTKTNAFARTIADPADPHAVVIDRHAMAIAYGRPMGADELSLTNKRYRAIAEAYRAAAVVAGELPSVVQAATWVHWRRTSAHRQAQVADRMVIA